MKKVSKIILTVALTAALLLGATGAALAHSGRTDSQGGHRDNKNVSGLGSYHYHHGMSAHLHPNGVCPYSTSSTSSASSSNRSTSTSQNTITYIPMYVNGQAVASANKPILNNNRALAPLRFVGESLGLTVEPKGDKIYLYASNINLVFTRGSKTYSVNGTNYTADAAPLLRNGVTYVPIRVIANSMGVQVNYQNEAVYLSV